MDNLTTNLTRKIIPSAQFVTLGHKACGF